MLPELDPRLKLRHFSLVVAIDESGSLRKAANMLKITQAAASSLLAELEFVLGAPLFSRSRSGTRPTNVGSILIERARPILSNIRAATEELQQAKGGASGDVYVGMLPVAALTIVPVAVRITREHKPNVRIHLIEGTTRQLLDALVRGDLDLIIGRVPQSQISGLIRKEYLLNEPNELVCRVGHPLTRKKKITLTDLANAEWILPEPGSYLWDDVRAMFFCSFPRPSPACPRHKLHGPAPCSLRDHRHDRGAHPAGGAHVRGTRLPEDPRLQDDRRGGADTHPLTPGQRADAGRHGLHRACA